MSASRRASAAGGGRGAAGPSPVGAPSVSTFFLLTAVAPALLAVLLGVFSSMTAPTFPVPAKGSAVVITGTSTGIGRHAAAGLAKAGYLVFAGVRKPQDADPLVAALGPERVVPLLLDVTDEEQVQRAAGQVEAVLAKRGVKLAALVNNAGIPYTIPVELLPLAELRRVFEVNVFGLVGVTQAFLPLLRRDQGRIVNIGSAAGITGFTVPLYGAYASSKHALEALSDAMRLELGKWRIAVSLLEPGTIVSEIRTKQQGAHAPHRKLKDPQQYELYSHFFDGYDERAAAQDASAGPVQLTTDAILHAVTSPSPKTRYVIGKFQGISLWWIRQFVLPLVPDHALDWVKLAPIRARAGGVGGGGAGGGGMGGAAPPVVEAAEA